MNSKLKTQLLGQIWELSDINKDGKLDADEFAIVRIYMVVFLVEKYVDMFSQAMHLVYKCLEGQALPDALPANLVPPSKRDKPMMAESKPMMAENKPMAPQPMMAESKPMMETKPMAPQPAMTESKPMITESKPMMAESKPMMAEHKPMAPQPPMMAESKPMASAVCYWLFYHEIVYFETWFRRATGSFPRPRRSSMTLISTRQTPTTTGSSLVCTARSKMLCLVSVHFRW